MTAPQAGESKTYTKQFEWDLRYTYAVGEVVRSRYTGKTGTVTRIFREPHRQWQIEWTGPATGRSRDYAADFYSVERARTNPGGPR